MVVLQLRLSILGLIQELAALLCLVLILVARLILMLVLVVIFLILEMVFSLVRCEWWLLSALLVYSCSCVLLCV